MIRCFFELFFREKEDLNLAATLLKEKLKSFAVPSSERWKNKNRLSLFASRIDNERRKKTQNILELFHFHVCGRGFDIEVGYESATVFMC